MHLGFEIICFVICCHNNDVLWDAANAGDIINIMVFDRFHVYRKVKSWVSWAFWEVFGAFGVTFGGLRGCRNVVNKSSKIRGSPGTSLAEGTHSLGVTPLSRGAHSNQFASMQVVKYKLRGCKLSTCQMRRTYKAVNLQTYKIGKTYKAVNWLD